MAKYLTLDGLTRFYEGLKSKFAVLNHNHDSAYLSINAKAKDSEKVNGLTVEKAVPSNAVFTDTVYTHSTGDGNLHVPATGTVNNGKVLKAGNAAGSADWGQVSFSEISGKPTSLSGYGINDGATKAELSAVEVIAKGASRALAFDTSTQLDNWLAGTYTRPDGKKKADLQIGDNLLIIARDVPDYWWDGTQKQELETGKVDLTAYVKSSDIAAITNIEIDAILAG